MFKFLKDKISEWTKKISESKEEKKVAKPKKEKKAKQVEQKKKEFKIPKKRQGTKEERRVSEELIKDIENEIKIKEREKKEEEKTSRANRAEGAEGGREFSREKNFESKSKNPSEGSSWGGKETTSENSELKGEESPEQEVEEKKGFFSKFKEKFTTTRISEEEFEKYSEDLVMILLENNVALEVAEKIINDLKSEITNKDIQRKEIEKEIKNSLKKIMENILIDSPDLIKAIKEKSEPYVMIFCGINGTGKTTTIAKVATLLKKKGISSVLAAGDTFRAASIEQLKLHGEKTKTKVIAHDYGSDPAAVGFDAVQYAKKNNIKVVLIDTAGRMHTAKNLLREMEKIVKVCKPDMKIFVGESTTGNDSVDQIKSFDETIGVDGIILSKADIDEKGGTALSVGYTTKKPILFLGIGQNYEDLEIFDKKKFIEKLGL